MPSEINQKKKRPLQFLAFGFGVSSTLGWLTHLCKLFALYTRGYLLPSRATTLSLTCVRWSRWYLIKQTDNPSLTLVVYIVYVVLCTLLMLNLLIAMMQKTFRADMRSALAMIACHCRLCLCV